MSLTLIGIPYGPLLSNTVHVIPAQGNDNEIVVIDDSTGALIIPSSIDYSVSNQITVTLFSAKSIRGKIY